MEKPLNNDEINALLYKRICPNCGNKNMIFIKKNMYEYIECENCYLEARVFCQIPYFGHMVYKPIEYVQSFGKRNRIVDFFVLLFLYPKMVKYYYHILKMGIL